MHILVAEDDAASRMILEASLVALGHHVTVAADGEAAWRALQTADFDAVVSDRSMPNMDGIELCRRIRAGDTQKYVYFIFLTSAKEKGRIAEGMAAGADDYLTKPIDLDELSARLIVAQRITGVYRRLENQQLEYRNLFENATVGIYRSTPAGKMLRANPALVRLNGYDSEAELMAAVNDIAREWYVQPQRRDEWIRLMREQGRVRDFVSEVYRHKTRERIWISENAWTIYGPDGEPVCFEGTLIEATDRKRAEAEMEYLARYDPLTDLANRTLLKERLEQAASWTTRHGGYFAVFCLDLDRFKAVNDAFGHAAGDLLLKEAALRLKAACRSEDTVARMGGDEFAIVQVGLDDPTEPHSVAQRILDAFHQPFNLEGQRALVGTSIGIAVAPDDGRDPQDLLKKADIALYSAKAEGRNLYRFFNTGIGAKTSRPFPPAPKRRSG
ncbi:MAG: diguanylate cyclase [Rhizobiaceae bacterium]|nr:diguanylate cyclase [Rhizobiaceae bacterium]MCV0406877.1 diguanylate cyclase [Rhizobiaceae bacterium]